MEGLIGVFLTCGQVWLFLMIIILFIAAFVVVGTCICKIVEKITTTIERFFDNL